MTPDKIKEEIIQLAALLASMMTPRDAAEYLERVAIDLVDMES